MKLAISTKTRNCTISGKTLLIYEIRISVTRRLPVGQISTDLVGWQLSAIGWIGQQNLHNVGLNQPASGQLMSFLVVMSHGSMSLWFDKGHFCPFLRPPRILH